MVGWKGDWLNYLINNVKVKKCKKIGCESLELDDKLWGYCKEKNKYVYTIKCERW